MSLSVRVPGTVLESVSVLSGGSADWALVSEQDGACYFAIGRLEGVGRVDGLIFSVIPAEYAHLNFIPLAVVLLNSGHHRRSSSGRGRAGSGGVHLVLLYTLSSF